VNQVPIIPQGDFDAAKKSEIRQVINNLIRSLPEQWLEVTDDGRLWERKIRREYSMLVAKKPTPIASVSFTNTYITLRDERTKKFNFTKNTEGPLVVYQALTGKKVKAARVWAGARHKFAVGKANDLTWRLLHNRLLTGTGVFWNPPDRQNCPIHAVNFSRSHIWVECEVAKATWQKAGELWGRLEKDTPWVDPISLDLFIALISLGPSTKVYATRRRWQVLFSTGAWCLWKASLSYSFGKPNQYWGIESTPAMFLSMMRKRIMTDRSLSISKIYSDRDYNPLKFKDLWGQDPYEIRVLKGPGCLLDSFQIGPQALEPESDPEDVLITQLSLLDASSGEHTDPFAPLDWIL
jgi:hypothetical protein